MLLPSCQNSYHLGQKRSLMDPSGENVGTVSGVDVDVDVFLTAVNPCWR